jgi:hypothetical protein
MNMSDGIEHFLCFVAYLAINFNALHMKKQLSVLVILTVMMGYVHAQGCSDAGFCTINSLKGDQQTEKTDYFNQLRVGFAFGQADNDVAASSGFVEYTRIFNEQFNMNLKMGYMAQKNDLASSGGLSDVFLTANYLYKASTFMAGFKIPLQDGNLLKDGMALPMDFQPSLGTFDLILGTAYAWKKFHFMLALQQPLSQNKNTFLNTDYPPNTGFNGYISTNEYKRKGDLLFRLTYQLPLTERLTLVPALLPIYHLGNDSYIDGAGKEVVLKGSQGLTFNGNLFVNFDLNDRSMIQLSLAAPFVTRDLRPDGLTRSFVAGLEYQFKL